MTVSRIKSITEFGGQMELMKVGSGFLFLGRWCKVHLMFWWHLAEGITGSGGWESITVHYGLY